VTLEDGQVLCFGAEQRLLALAQSGP
jgi:hypothetical protein